MQRLVKASLYIYSTLRLCCCGGWLDLPVLEMARSAQGVCVVCVEAEVEVQGTPGQEVEGRGGQAANTTCKYLTTNSLCSSL